MFKNRKIKKIFKGLGFIFLFSFLFIQFECDTAFLLGDRLVEQLDFKEAKIVYMRGAVDRPKFFKKKIASLPKTRIGYMEKVLKKNEYKLILQIGKDKNITEKILKHKNKKFLYYAGYRALYLGRYKDALLFFKKSNIAPALRRSGTIYYFVFKDKKKGVKYWKKAKEKGDIIAALRLFSNKYKISKNDIQFLYDVGLVKKKKK